MNKKFLITGMMLSCLIGTSFNAEAMGAFGVFRNGQVEERSAIEVALLRVAPEKPGYALPVPAVDNIALINNWRGRDSTLVDELTRIHDEAGGRGAVERILTNLTPTQQAIDAMENQSGMYAWRGILGERLGETSNTLSIAYAAMIGPDNDYLAADTTADGAKTKADQTVRAFLRRTPIYGQVIHPLQVEGLLNYTYKATLLRVLAVTENLVYSGVPRVGMELPEDLLSNDPHFDALLGILYNTKRVNGFWHNDSVGDKYERGTDSEVKRATLSIYAVARLMGLVYDDAIADADRIIEEMNPVANPFA